MTRWFTLLLLVAASSAIAGERVFEKVPFGGWENCFRLGNGQIELIVTTDVGPRVIRLGFVDGQNLFATFEEQLGKTGGDEWRIYGGHRLWHSPERIPRSYAPDNSPVGYEWDGERLKIQQGVEKENQVRKEIEISVSLDANHVTVLHRITNVGPWEITLAPWALTVMAPRGRAILPQEDYRSHEESAPFPARPVVLWHYTDMSDPRWTWGERHIQLRQDPTVTAKQKIGVRNSKGWAAYVLEDDVFIKRHPFDEGAEYPDFGCNAEIFTQPEFLEVESLGPLTRLAPNGGSVEHVEHWFLFKGEIGDEDKEIDESLMPLVRRTEDLLK
jgi:hypothetical protein